jgi:hypothetical protein
MWAYRKWLNIWKELHSQELHDIYTNEDKTDWARTYKSFMKGLTCKWLSSIKIDTKELDASKVVGLEVNTENIEWTISIHSFLVTSV